MSNIWKFYCSEWRRVKSTSVVYLALGVPFLMGIVVFLNVESDTTVSILYPNLISMWAVMVLPICSIVLSLVSTYQFHSSQMWKVILAQPFSRLQVFIAHILFNFTLIFASVIVMFLMFALNIFLVSIDKAYSFSLVYELIPQFFGSFPAIFLITGLTMFSSSLIFSLSIGIGGYIACSILYTTVEKYQYLYIFMYPMWLTSNDNIIPPVRYLAPLVASVIILLISYMFFRRKEI